MCTLISGCWCCGSLAADTLFLPEQTPTKTIFSKPPTATSPSSAWNREGFFGNRICYVAKPLGMFCCSFVCLLDCFFGCSLDDVVCDWFLGDLLFPLVLEDLLRFLLLLRFHLCNMLVDLLYYREMAPLIECVPCAWDLLFNGFPFLGRPLRSSGLNGKSLINQKVKKCTTIQSVEFRFPFGGCFKPTRTLHIGFGSSPYHTTKPSFLPKRSGFPNKSIYCRRLIEIVPIDFLDLTDPFFF